MKFARCVKLHVAFNVETVACFTLARFSFELHVVESSVVCMSTLFAC